MNRVFGKKKASGPPAPSLSEASSGVGNQMENLDAKINPLDKELKAYRDKLKSTVNAAAKNSLQKRAMEVLKRKKMYETQRDQLAGQQFNIDQAAFGIESAKATVSTVAAMKAANSELKRTMKHDLKIEDVDELADDMAEMMSELNEINEALSTNFATPNDIDEADLEAELDMLCGMKGNSEHKPVLSASAVEGADTADDFYSTMTVPLAGSPSETTAVRPNTRELLAAAGGSNPSLMSMGCSGKSLMSMDLCLRSEDFGGALDGIMSSDDDDDDDDGGINGGIYGDFDCDDGGTRPIQSSDFVENVLLAELKAPGWAREPTEGTEPSLSRPQNEAHDLRAMSNLTSQLERISTGTPLSNNCTDRISSSGWAKDFEIDADGMGTMDPSLFDGIPSNSYSLSRPSPSSHYHEGYASLHQPEHPISDINGMLNPPTSSSRSSETSNVRNMSSTSSRPTRTIDDSRAIEPTDDDVLFGRGGYTNTHPGNIFFRKRALELRPWYETCSKEEKYHVSNVLIESVKSAGHRFLAMGVDGLWHEVIGNEVRKKASQALRERVSRKSRGGESLPPSSSYQV